MHTRLLACALLVSGVGAAAVAPAVTPAHGAANPAPVALYDRSVEAVAQGHPDEAMALLRRAIAGGYQDWQAIKFGPALAPLREREDWPALVADFDARNPWQQVHDFSGKLPHSPWTEYAIGLVALRDGTAPTAERVSSPAVPGYFLQLHVQRASLVGDYDYGHANYFGGFRPFDVADKGIVRFKPAITALEGLVAGRRVVMLNESHGRSAERAANFQMVRALRELGFTHLALEALSYERLEGDACRNSAIKDTGLHGRGHALRETGAYTNDPIYAELVRMALAEGYRLVAYDHTYPDPKSPQREEDQANNIHCILKDDPSARVVVIGGGGHTSRSPDTPMAGGMMGLRLAERLEPDPFSIAVQSVRLVNVPDGAGEGGLLDPGTDAALAGQPYFAETSEGLYAPAGYDASVFYALPKERSADAGWLRLGGWRVPAPAVPLDCSNAPCLLEARRVGESADAVPGDRCVVAEAGRSCQLFLSPGEYEVVLLDAASERSEPYRLLVAGPG